MPDRLQPCCILTSNTTIAATLLRLQLGVYRIDSRLLSTLPADLAEDLGSFAAQPAPASQQALTMSQPGGPGACGSAPGCRAGTGGGRVAGDAARGGSEAQAYLEWQLAEALATLGTSPGALGMLGASPAAGPLPGGSGSEGAECDAEEDIAAVVRRLLSGSAAAGRKASGQSTGQGSIAQCAAAQSKADSRSTTVVGPGGGGARGRLASCQAALRTLPDEAVSSMAGEGEDNPGARMFQRQVKWQQHNEKR